MAEKDNDTIIMDRAECICEICQQMQWRECTTGPLSYHCDQLISKFADHDYPYMWKSEAFENGNRWHYIKIAGIKTPFEVLDKYVSHIVNRLEELKIHSRYVIKEMNVGKLEDERRTLHLMVMQSVGFQAWEMTPAARFYAGALEKYVEYRAKHNLSMTTDMEIGIWENVIERHGIKAVREKFKCPEDILKRWEEEHEES